MTDALLRLELSRGDLRLAVDLAWNERVVVLFGPSGAGKSSLLEAVLGLHPLRGARVRLGGAWLEDASRGLRLPVERRGLGWVPQEPTLFPHLSVEQNLRFGAARVAEADSRRGLERAVDVLELHELLPRPVDTLSGGERQRVALGRAIASGPRALLLDEPLASLDLARRARVLGYLLRVRDELGLPMLYVTHDPDEALLVGERVVVLDAGRELSSGPPAEVLWSAAVLPLSESLGLENVFEGRAGAQDVATLVTAGGLRLALPVAVRPDERVCVGVRAEDVLLAADPPGRVSARNVFDARVARCQPEGRDTFVHLELPPGGERLVAKITAAAAEKLELRPGNRVHALVKAQAIRRLA